MICVDSTVAREWLFEERHTDKALAANDLLRPFLRFPVALSAPPQMHERALRLAHRFDLPAVCDAQYVALAELEGCEMWADDQRLIRDLAGRVPNVRWIGDYAGG